jgi:hypothetical protein
MKSDFDNIKRKYQSAKSFEGDDDEVFAGKETIAGKWKLVEADTPIASHDETTFHKTPGFPTGKDGATINDRDYGHDKAAQEAVVSIGADFDGRALKVDNPIIVTKDGIVISGNNRTMSSKIAARKGTDTKYIEALKKRAKKFGFTEEQVGQFKNPRVVFEVENSEGYSTDQFAKFNQSSKKEMGPTEKAVKVSKMIKPETVKNIANKISEYETLGELYRSGKDTYEIIEEFVKAGLIGEYESDRYWANGAITDDGKTFIETSLVGSIMNESNIRGFERPGCKSIRAVLARAIIPLIENKDMDGYSINRELNEAVDIAMQVAIDRDKFKSVEDFSKQGNMFEALDPVAVELAKKLEGTQKAFAEFMQKMNGGMKYAASGEADIFLGGVETKEQILSRFLGMKKSIMAALDFFRNRLMKKPEEDIETEKSLTWSGYPLQGRTKIHGMDISIENKKGSTRSGTDKDGKPWSQKMGWDYGYIRGTVGKDKDHVDCFVGPNPESEKVFVIHQVDPFTDGHPFDEDKIMLGWDNAKDAKIAYLEQYNRPDFFGNMDEMGIDEFKDKIFDEKNKGQKIAGGSIDEN